MGEIGEISKGRLVNCGEIDGVALARKVGVNRHGENPFIKVPGHLLAGGSPAWFSLSGYFVVYPIAGVFRLSESGGLFGCRFLFLDDRLHAD